ncbi:MAG TPA: hypothetical protein VM712_12655 [Gaiellales bacterium]|jgi:hypothetical protein|nr:hypothetical protein [Gaiellales bacterium]
MHLHPRTISRRAGRTGFPQLEGELPIIGTPWRADNALDGVRPVRSWAAAAAIRREFSAKEFCKEKFAVKLTA